MAYLSKVMTQCKAGDLAVLSHMGFDNIIEAEIGIQIVEP